MALSSRLRTLLDIGLVEDKNHVYDLCCDHGELALAFHERLKNKKVFANDISKKVIETLRKKTQGKVTQNFEIIDSDAQKIKFRDDSLFIVAGVGAYTSIKIIENILSQNLKNFSLITCCHQNEEDLRLFLREKSPLKLKDEFLVEDRGQFYVIMQLCLEGSEISPIASLFWMKTSKKVCQSYLEHKIGF